MNEKLLTPEISALIKQRNWTVLRETITQWELPEIADLLLELDKVDRVLVFRVIPRDLSSEVFAYLEAEEQNSLLKDLSDEETRYLLAELSPDDRTHLFEELPGRATQKLLNLLSPEDLQEARQLLGYPEETVGRLMTPDYVAVRPEWTITQALEQIRLKGHDSETLNVIYVTDRSWKLIDALELHRFILADPGLKVEEIMDRSFASLSAFDDREQAVQVMQRYDLSVLPVVDSAGVLVGIVTFDDVLDVAQEEATEDFHKTAAVSPLRGSYRETSFRELYQKRIGWLVALVFTNILSGAAIASYQKTITAVFALIFFLPLLIASAGNAGSQSATLMIRALAMGEVRLSDWARLLAKELAISTALGLTMGCAVWGVGLYRGGSGVGAVVLMTMIIVVIIGSTIGTLLPLALSRFGMDPATASGPLITSLADISGVIIYFSIATWYLGLS